MYIKKTGEIEFKVLKMNDIERLAKFFMDIENEEKDTQMKITIEFTDQSIVEGDKPYILEETKNKIIKSIRIFLYTLNSSSTRKDIHLYISNYSGHYSIESDEKDWVDAKFSQLKETISIAPNQIKILADMKCQTLINAMLGSLIGIIFYYNVINLKDINKEATSTLFLIVFLVILGQVIVYPFVGRVLKKLYPINDFETTHDHLNSSKRKKVICRNILVTIIVPFIISFIVSRF